MQKVWTLRLPFLCAFFTNTYCGFNFFLFFYVCVCWCCTYCRNCITTATWHLYAWALAYVFAWMCVCVCVCMWVCAVSSGNTNPWSCHWSGDFAILQKVSNFDTHTHAPRSLQRFLFVLHISQFFVVIFSCCS